MSSIINNDNYESVFFKLIENEYSDKERKGIINEIDSDPFYAFEWECWQKTKLRDESKELGLIHKSFLEDIKSQADLFAIKSNRRVIPFYLKVSAIAACLFLGVTITYLLNHDSSGTEGISKNHSSEKIKNQSMQPVPADPVPQPETRPKTGRPVPMDLDQTIKTLPRDLLLIAETDTLRKPKLVKHIEIPVIPGLDTARAAFMLATNSQEPAFKRKFTVTPPVAIQSERIVQLSELEASHTHLITFFDNKRITVVRKNKKLYLKLVEEDEGTIYLSLK